MTSMDDYEPDDDEINEEDPEKPGESSSRSFLSIVGILSIVVLLFLVSISVYAMVILPRSRDTQSTEMAEMNAQSTEVALLSFLTASPFATPTLEADALEQVSAPTKTPASNKDISAADPRTATVASLLTQQAGKTTLTPNATQLPDTGFMDDVGISGMVALALSLVLVIILARRLRTGS